MAGDKKADRKRENTEECIHREPFFASRSSFFRQLHTVFLVLCFARFFLLVLTRLANDHGAHNPTTTFFHWRPRCNSQNELIAQSQAEFLVISDNTMRPNQASNGS